jgi:hypothetical protein
MSTMTKKWANFKFFFFFHFSAIFSQSQGQMELNP